ncbi:MAG TPA: response regulator [Vicinamibacterales bacterium]|nr:response regulator [Vicinamibacterales bacterium]
MSPASERRDVPDRRTTPRGGRRPQDPQGYSPLILVADDDANSGARCVAILARLRFAVAPAHTVEEAIKVMEALKPNLIVARLRDEPALRHEMETNPEIGDIPMITLTSENDAPQLMIEEIRRALNKP